MQYVVKILKEIGLAVLGLGLIFLVGFLLFRDQLPFLSSDIPKPVTYNKLDLAQFEIKGDLETQKDPTKSYEATTWSLKNLEELRKVHTGTPNPFSSALDEDRDSDIPSERVTIANSADRDVTAGGGTKVKIDPKVDGKYSIVDDGVTKQVTVEGGQYTESWQDASGGMHVRSTNEFDDDGNPIFPSF